MTVITGMNLVLATIFLFLLKNFSSWLVILMFILFVMIKNLFVLFFSLCSLVFIAVVLNPVSFFDRIVWFIIGIRMWKDNFLFGVGPGNFKFFYPSYVINIPFLPSIATIFTHNYFVQMAAELGVIWLIFFLLFLYTIMKNVKIGSKKYLFPLCGVLIQNFVDYNLLIPQNSILFFIFFSLFLSDMDKKECQCSVNIVFEQNKYRYFLFIIMCLCLYGIFFSIKIEKIVRLCSSPAEADMLTAVNKDKTCWQAYKQLAMYAIENKEVDKAQQLLLKTLKYNPADAETYLYLAVINFRFGNKKNGYKFLSQAVKLNPRNAYRYVKQIQNI